MVYLTRRERFNAAHKLYREDWSEEKNREVFGKCANHNYHGHNFELFITIKGNVDPETGFTMNAKHLSKLIKEEVVKKLDHMNVNVDVEFMKGVIPTTENMAKAIWKVLVDKIEPGQLHCVKLCETENIFVEYYGE